MLTRSSGRVGSSLHVYAGAVDASGQQGRVGSSCAVHSGDGTQAIQQLVVQRAGPLIVVAIQLRIDSEQHEVLRIEADIHVSQVLKCSQEQAGANQQHDAKSPTCTTSSIRLRRLRDPTTLRPVSFSAVFTLMPVASQRRRDAEHEAGQTGYSCNKRENAPIEWRRLRRAILAAAACPSAQRECRAHLQLTQATGSRSAAGARVAIESRRATGEPISPSAGPSRATATGWRRWRRR